MSSIVFAIYVLLILILLSFKSNKLNNIKLIYLFGVSFILFAGLRDGKFFSDYDSYVDIFNNGGDYEISILLISKFIKLFSQDSIYLFLVYAFIGVTLKITSIRKLTPYIYISLIVYFSNYYLLHEMTQIRVGVAAGFFLLAIPALYNKEKIKAFVILSFAVLFHYSAVILLLLFFLNPKNINKKYWLWVIPIVYIVYFLGFKILNYSSVIGIEYFQFRFNDYITESEFQNTGEKLNVLNIIQISQCLFCMFLIFYSNKISSINKYSPILIKVYTLGLSSYVLFSDLPVLSFRISQLLNVVEIILIPFVFYVIKNRYISSFIVVFIGVIFLYYNLVYTHLIL